MLPYQNNSETAISSDDREAFVLFIEHVEDEWFVYEV